MRPDQATRALRTFSALAAVVCVLAALGAAAPAPPPADAPLFAAAPAFSAIAALPAGLMLPSVDASAQVARLLTADIDADGDLDVVATGDHGLELSVWVNDGTGHLTRKRPSRDRT